MLRKLIIRNIRGLEALDVDIAGPLVLMGRNGSGKTSTLDAIRYICCGAAKDRTGRTLPKGDILRYGAKEGSITLETDRSRLALAIGKSTTMALEGRTAGSLDEMRAEFWRRSKMSVSDYGLFPPVHDLTDPLSGLAVALDPDKLRIHCGDRHDEIMAYAASCRVDLETVADGTRLAEIAYAERTGVNQTVKRLTEAGGDDDDAPPEWPMGKGGKPITPDVLPLVIETIPKLRAKREAALSKLASATTIHESVSELEESLIAAREGRAEKVRITQEIAALRAQLEKEDGDKAIAQARCEVAEKRMKAIAAGKCPTCERPYDGADKTAAENEQFAAHEQFKRIVGAQSPKRERIAALTAELSAIPDLGDPELIVARIAQKREASDAGTAQQELDDLTERIKNAESAVMQVQSIIERQRARAELADMKHRAGLLTAVVDLFREGRAAAAAGAGGVAAWLATAEGVMQGVGLRLRVTTTPKGDRVVEVCRKDKWVPSWSLSDSEEVLAGAAIGAAFAAPSGIVLVDRVESLDSWARQKLFKLIKERPGISWVLAMAWGNGVDEDEARARGEKLATAINATVVWMG